MGRFDGILIATDLDGTLATRGLEFNKRDIDAIEYFKSEGGLFTLATGRVTEYVKKNILSIVKPNAPIVTLNGATICDSECNRYLYKSFISDYKERLDKLKNYRDFIEELYVYYDGCISADVIKASDFSSAENIVSSYGEIHKIVFAFKDEGRAVQAMNESNSLFRGDGNICLRSWPLGLEILSERNTKDRGVLKVKEMTQAKTLVCAGDFENDIPMLKAADIGYAVGNALDSVKASADRIACAQSEAAIAYIINDATSLL